MRHAQMIGSVGSVDKKDRWASAWLGRLMDKTVFPESSRVIQNHVVFTSILIPFPTSTTTTTTTLGIVREEIRLLDRSATAGRYWWTRGEIAGGSVSWTAERQCSGGLRLREG